jgi:hypothetical protein
MRSAQERSTPVFFRHAVEITKLVEFASNALEKAIENTAKREVKNAMAQFRAFLDKVMQTNGNGVLGAIGSITTTGLPSGVAAQFGMAKPPGAQLFYYNQTVQVYDPTLTTNRGSANVLLVDPFNSLIQVDSLPTGTSVNDLIVHDGLTGAQPTSLFGILYHQTNATTGTWLNLNRATYPVELATPVVNGNNSAITPGAVRLAINKVRKRLIRVTRETHEAPLAIQGRVRQAGGTNLYGEANFRVVWGGSRLTWIGGRWIDRDSNGNILREAIETRRVPKYLPLNRWHIERWTPRESYGSPDEWYAQTIEVEDGVRIAALGPYPSRGEYEHCFTLESAGGEFLALTPTACDWIVHAIEWSRHQPRRQIRGAIAAREARRARDWDRDADALLDDAVAAFHGAPFVAGARG